MNKPRKYEYTEEQRQQVFSLYAEGCNHKLIAVVVKLPLPEVDSILSYLRKPPKVHTLVVTEAE